MSIENMETGGDEKAPELEGFSAEEIKEAEKEAKMKEEALETIKEEDVEKKMGEILE